MRSEYSFGIPVRVHGRDPVSKGHLHEVYPVSVRRVTTTGARSPLSRRFHVSDPWRFLLEWMSRNLPSVLTRGSLSFLSLE